MNTRTKYYSAISVGYAAFFSLSASAASLPMRDSRFWLQMPGISYRSDHQEWDGEIETDGTKSDKSFSQSESLIYSGGSPYVGGRFDNHAVMVSTSSLAYDYYVQPDLAIGGRLALDLNNTDNEFLLSKTKEKNTENGVSFGPAITYWHELNDTSALYTTGVLRLHSRKTSEDVNKPQTSENTSRSYEVKASPSFSAGIFYLCKFSENISAESGVSFFVQKITSTTKRTETDGSTTSSFSADQDSTFTRISVSLFSLIFSI